MGHKKGYWSVYRKKDDKPIFIHGTQEECAKAMGIKTSSFKAMASNQRNGKRCGSRSKYEIVRDIEDGEEN